jgi:hypothetical protein
VKQFDLSTAPSDKKWLPSNIKKIKIAEKPASWKMVTFTTNNLMPNAKT